MSSEIEKSHHCEEKWHQDVEVRFEKINKEQWSWVLEQTWIATQNEVDDKLAERESEQICSHVLLVAYCPFCGLNLSKISRNTW